jgi:hypothetical protein
MKWLASTIECFVSDEESSSQAYRDFWKRLQEGTFHQAEYKRVAKSGEA